MAAAPRILTYTLVILLTGGLLVLLTGDWRALDPARVIAGLLFAPLFGAVFWYRWDWAPARRREVEAEPPDDLAG